MIGAGATGRRPDASNLLKPALQSGTAPYGVDHLQRISRPFRKGLALARRFQKIDVNEPSIDDAIKILKGLSYYEDHHKVRYTNEALKTAVELAARYIGDRKLPDKAIDVIDEVGAAQMLVPEAKRRKTIGVKEVEAVIAKIARIPPKTVSTDDKTVLANLERDPKPVFGQDPAINPWPAPSSYRAPVCGNRKSRLAITCFPAQPASAKPRSRANWPTLLASNWCASTCRNTWNGTACPA